MRLGDGHISPMPTPRQDLEQSPEGGATVAAHPTYPKRCRISERERRADGCRVGCQPQRPAPRKSRNRKVGTFVVHFGSLATPRPLLGGAPDGQLWPAPVRRVTQCSSHRIKTLCEGLVRGASLETGMNAPAICRHSQPSSQPFQFRASLRLLCQLESQPRRCSKCQSCLRPKQGPG